jgi:predicted permease
MAAGFVTRLWLLAYPPAIRREHGDEIVLALSESWRRERGLRARARLIALFFADAAASWRRVPVPGAPHRGAGRKPWRTGQIASDVKNAIRQFTQSPMFGFGAVTTLALGIGAVTVIFSLADATLLRPFPFPEPERIVQTRFSWAQPDFRDLAAGQHSFSTVAAWTNTTMALERNSRSTTIDAAFVSGGFFPMIALRAERGRLLEETDDRPTASTVVVLSDRLWRTEFGADPAAVGMTVHLNRQPVTIVGVAPPEFRGLSLTSAPELFVPLASVPSVGTGFLARMFDRRNAVWLDVGGRLNAGVTMDDAARDVDSIYRALHPPKNASEPPEKLQLEPLAVWGPGAATGTELGRFLLVLFGASVITLLLSCATVANLLMMRAERRQRELAVRSALGAGRWQIVRMLMIESAMIGLAGGVVGLLLARIGLPVLAAFNLPGRIRIHDLTLTVSPTALAIGIGLGLGTSLLFGLAPFWQSRRLSVTSTLRNAGRGSAHQPLRMVLVATQVAVCTLLLAGSLAFGRAIRHGLSVDLGFDTTHAVLMPIDPTLARYTPPQIAALQSRTLEVFRAQPWVDAVAWSSVLPVSGRMTGGAGVEDRSRKLGADKYGVDTQLISAGFFEALQIPLAAGRPFSDEDRDGAPGVAIVNETLARQGWPDGRALGQRITTDPDAASPVWLTVVGVVRDIRRGVTRAPDPTIYLPYMQRSNMLEFAGRNLIVRSSLAPDAALRAGIDTFRQVDPLVPIGAAQTIETHVRGLLISQRLGITLFALFAAAALMLTGFGLYAVIAYAVAHRTREIGIRLALGAERGRVLRLVARQGLMPLAGGLVIGGAGCWWAGRAIEQFLFTLPAVTAWTVAVLLAAIAGLSAVATIVPARRALAIDPAITLRSE